MDDWSLDEKDTSEPRRFPDDERGNSDAFVGKRAKRRLWLLLVAVFFIGASAGYLVYGGIGRVGQAVLKIVGIKSGEESASPEAKAPAGHGEGEQAAAKPEEATEEAMQIHLTPEEQTIAAVRTVEVMPKVLKKEIRTVGRIEYDERKLAFVSARVAGRIDKLFVNFTGMTVQKGQPLLELYSPDLVTAQQEYLLALNTLEQIQESRRKEVIDGAKALVEAAQQRLLLWGISEGQIAKLEEERKPKIHMTIYSPITGTVIEKKALEGKYLAVGEPLYTIADLSNVWMLADVYEYEMAWLKLGQEVEITTPSYPERPFKGKISFVYPGLEERTRTVKVRAEVNPDGKLKPGMFVNANLVTPAGKAVLAVPTSAILDAGIRKFAWVELGHSRFERREIKVGPEVSGYYPVLAGLSKGEKVVTSANFLIDSQAQLGAGAAAGGHGGH